MCQIINIKKSKKFSPKTINLVDNGVWTLWIGNSDKNKKIVYALNTGDEYFFLDKDGSVLEIKSEWGDFKKNDIARFTKIEHLPNI